MVRSPQKTCPSLSRIFEGIEAALLAAFLQGRAFERLKWLKHGPSRSYTEDRTLSYTVIEDAVLAHQTTKSAMTNVQADLSQPFRHARPAIAAQAETGLFVDMRKLDLIGPLAAAGWAAA